jgi:hypothetical protein
MVIASHLAGFCAAHALWSLYESGTFTPMFAYTNANNERSMERLVAQDFRESVELGKRKLASNEIDANDAVLLYGGQITTGAEKREAIVIEIRAYFMPSAELTIAVPYAPKSSGKFVVLRPQVVTWKKCEDFTRNSISHEFFSGVQEHEIGSKIWREHYNSSM